MIAKNPFFNYRRSPLSFGGFTLIELLITIALVSILSVAVTVALNPASRVKQARDANRKSSLAQIVSGLGSFNAQALSYPHRLDDLVPGELKALPKTPFGETFGYEALTDSDSPCTTTARDCQKVVVYDLYELPSPACEAGKTAYLAWTSNVVSLGKICSATLPTPNDRPTPE